MDSSLVVENGIYCRAICKSRSKLEKELVTLYNLPVDEYDVAVLPSGIAAIAAVLTDLLRFRKDSTVVIPTEMYSETPEIPIYLADQIIRVDIYNDKQVLDTILNNDVDIFLFESCSNPSGYMFNFELLKHFPKSVATVCDNTWLSPILFNPINYNVSIVVESLTKYHSGGKCIGGMVLAKKKYMENIHYFCEVYGQYVGSDHCQIFLNGLKSIKDRVNSTSDLTMNIAKHLSTKTQVLYPMLESHPTYKISKKYLLNGGPCCVYFKIPCHEDSVLKIINKVKDCQFILYETSYGSRSAKIDPFPEYKEDGLWCRLAIGYETDKENLIKELNKLLI